MFDIFTIIFNKSESTETKKNLCLRDVFSSPKLTRPKNVPLSDPIYYDLDVLLDETEDVEIEPQVEKLPNLRARCLDCGKVFDHRNNAYRHWNSLHRPVPMKKRVCSLCGTVLKDIYVLKNHLRKSHGITKPKGNRKTASNY